MKYRLIIDLDIEDQTLPADPHIATVIDKPAGRFNIIGTAKGVTINNISVTNQYEAHIKPKPTYLTELTPNDRSHKFYYAPWHDDGDGVGLSFGDDPIDGWAVYEIEDDGCSIHWLDEDHDTCRRVALLLNNLHNNAQVLKLMPNGFEDWSETHYEVVANLEHALATDDEKNPVVILHSNHGHGALWQTAHEWTNQFEQDNIGRSFDGSFFDAIDAYMERRYKEL